MCSSVTASAVSRRRDLRPRARGRQGFEHVFPAKCENGDESFSRCAVGTQMAHLDRCQPFPVGGLDLRNQIPLGIGELEDAGRLALGEIVTDSTCPSPTNHSDPRDASRTRGQLAAAVRALVVHRRRTVDAEGAFVAAYCCGGGVVDAGAAPLADCFHRQHRRSWSRLAFRRSASVSVREPHLPGFDLHRSHTHLPATSGVREARPARCCGPMMCTVDR